LQTKQNGITTVMLYIVLLSGVILVIAAWFFKESTIKNEIESNLKLNGVYISESSENFRTLSENVHDIIVNNPYNKALFIEAMKSSGDKRNELRQKLYDNLKLPYQRLSKLWLRQLHYHYPDNRSFLRMHAPDKFDDDLSDVRYSIRYVNEHKKPIEGFEVGRVVSGFRYVYPLFDDEKNHIGSVEASISSAAFINHIEQTYGADVHFIIDKDVAEKKLWGEYIEENYTPAHEGSDFYLEKSKNSHVKHHANEAFFSKHEQEIHQKIKTEEPFAIYAEPLDMIVSFIPVRSIDSQEIVAYFTLYTDNERIPVIENLFWIAFAVILAYVSLLLTLLLKDRNRQQAIIDMNEALETRITAEVEKNQRRDHFMMQQSRLIQLGEMISMIAHQWRQPLAAVNTVLIDVKMRMALSEMGKDDEQKELRDYIDSSLDEIEQLILSMSGTIDDFRNFYKPSKSVTRTDIGRPLDKAVQMVKKSYDAKEIELRFDEASTRQLTMHESELTQTFLNIINNAHDALIDNRVEEPWIEISTVDVEDGVVVTICDNAGGVPEALLDKIFDPYFSTKESKNGTGLGLYMSKIIVEEHHLGYINVENGASGACFTIHIKDLKEKSPA
jgi:signal transduction histidine kinase